jgi:effector-binding domain-containing protein
MIDAPQILQTTTQPIAVIPLTIPKADMRTVMGPAVTELLGAVAAQGIGQAVPWFTHHLKIVPDQWDFEIGVPVIAPVVAVGRVKPSQWTSMQAARTIYSGPYEGLGEAWGEFIAWIAANGHTTTDELWERYLPTPESRPADYRTELTKRLTR